MFVIEKKTDGGWKPVRLVNGRCEVCEEGEPATFHTSANAGSLMKELQADDERARYRVAVRESAREENGG